MRRISIALLLLLCAAATQARSLSYMLKASESIIAKEPQPAAAPMLIRFRGGSAKEARAAFSTDRAGTPKPPAYDITRETGAYFFDTVYKFRMPATKRLYIGLNGGYTFYDRYLRGFGKGGGSLGLVGGVTLTLLRPAKVGSAVRKSFFRLNADLISYPYRYKAGGKEAYDLSRYTRDLSARVYMDARIVIRRGFTTRCMAGVVASGSEQQSYASPLFVGFAVAYRFP